MRTARNTLLVALALAAPYLVVGIWSDGPFAGRVLQGGIVLLVISGLAGVWMWHRGQALDREQDERARLILYKTALFTCFTTAVGLQLYWASRFATEGNAGDDVFWVLALFWASFAGAYLINLRRN